MSTPNQLAIDAFKEAKAFDQKGDYQASIEAYRRAVRHGIDDADAWFSLGYAHNSLHQSTEALACWNKVLEREPAHPMAWNNKADSLLHLGSYEEAIATAQRALELGAMEGWHTLAECYEAQGQVGMAINALESFLAEASSDYDGFKPEAREYIERLRSKANEGAVQSQTVAPEKLRHFILTGKMRSATAGAGEGLGFDETEADARRKARMDKLLGLKKINQ